MLYDVCSRSTLLITYCSNIFREVKGVAGKMQYDVEGVGEKVQHNISRTCSLCWFDGILIDNPEIIQDMNTTAAAQQFWERALALGPRYHDYTIAKLVEGAAKTTEPVVTGIINHAVSTMQVIVAATENHQNTIAQEHGASLDDINNRVEKVLDDRLGELKDQFPPPDEAPSRAERRDDVSAMPHEVKDAFVKPSIQHDMAVEKPRVHCDPNMKHVKTVVVTLGTTTFCASSCAQANVLLGDLAVLFVILIIFGIILIVPESWLLRPLLRMFGMAAEGPVAGAWTFLPTRIHLCACSLLALVYACVHCLCSCVHVVEFGSSCVSFSFAPHSCHVSVYVHTHYLLIGSPVAWAQRRFYGAYIPKDSWFSYLQRPGMTHWANPIRNTIGGSILVGIGIAGSLFYGPGQVEVRVGSYEVCHH